VPLGAFLSGGIDSSLVAALMQKTSTAPIRTFTIGFDDEFYDEARHAKEVARHLGTEHTEWSVTAREALRVIPTIPTVYDEPFSDPSQIPTCVISEFTRRHVTVALSGDGGDELFAGYRRYFQCMSLWRRANMFPRPVRKLAGLAMTLGARCPAVDPLVRALKPFLPEDWTSRPASDLLAKLSMVVKGDTPYTFYRSLTSHWARPVDMVLGGSELRTHASDPSLFADVGQDFTRQMMYLDMMMYHPDDILAKVDRASMAVGLEARVPFIDHRVVEFAASLPMEYLLHRGKGKRILREILYKYVARDLVDRPKKGFGVPLASWLRGELRDWGEEYLSERRLSREGYLYPRAVREKWTEHVSGNRNWQHHLWDVLMFETWLDAQS
jgi:asparagine synthase (glutamine-hydrolysing)